MVVETDYGPIEVVIEGEDLVEVYAESVGLCGEQGRALDRHGRDMAELGLDFADTGGIVIADRHRALAYLGRVAVERLERAIAYFDKHRSRAAPGSELSAEEETNAE